MSTEIKVYNLATKNQEGSKLLATAGISLDGIRIKGWKLVKNIKGLLVVYPPSTKGLNGYKPVIDVDRSTMDVVSEKIIAAYNEKLENPKVRNNDPPQLTNINYNLMRHFYRKRKQELTALRIYLAARQIVDFRQEKNGRADIKDLCRILKISKKHLLMQCRKNPLLFSGYSDRFIYYRCLEKIMRACRLRISRSIIRQERITARLLKFFSSNRLFKSYITMATMEKDVGRFGYTKGRISLAQAAKDLLISPKTVFNHIKKSQIKKEKHIRSYPQYRFHNIREFHNWMANNKNTVVDKELGDRIGDNVFSYFAKITKGGDHVLARRLPNHYKITAIRQIKKRRRKPGIKK